MRLCTDITMSMAIHQPFLLYLLSAGSIVSRVEAMNDTWHHTVSQMAALSNEACGG